MNNIIKCEVCDCTTDEYLPDPRDEKQEIMVCVDCEYAITECYSAEPFNPSLSYAEATHGA